MMIGPDGIRMLASGATLPNGKHSMSNAHDVAAFRRWLTLPALPSSNQRPANNPDQARERFAELLATDEGIGEATRAKLIEPEGVARATVVVWHGFTNAPSQFTLVGEALAAQGYRVLLPRMPFHGEADVLNHHLADLTVAQLLDHADACMDIVAGFPEPIWVGGLSAGATLAAWVAANRPRVQRLVLAAPLIAPKAMPMPLVRLFARSPRLLPKVYYWWDPRKKADLPGSPYAYPGFPSRGILPFLQISEAMFDRSVTPGHQLERVVLIANPGDFAIRRDVAKAFAEKLLFPVADTTGIANLDPELHWMHDFVDPNSPDTGTTEQVVAVFLAAFGAGSLDADGLIVPALER